MGARVLLVERHGFPGGMNTAALVSPIMTFHAGKEQIIRGIAQELIDRLAELGGTMGHIPDPLGVASTITPVDTELLKLVYQRLLGEAGVECLFHGFISGLTLEGNRIRSLDCVYKGGREEIAAPYFIDATGDGDLAALGGLDFWEGREADGLSQPMTLILKVGGVDLPRLKKAMAARPGEFVLDPKAGPVEELPYLAVSGFFGEVERARKAGDFSLPRDRALLFQGLRPGELIVNMTRVTELRGTRGRELSAAEEEGRRQALETLRFLKKYIPGCGESVLLALGAQIGVRESRRIKGAYTVSAEDVIRGRSFPDSVARGGFPIDIHDPAGKGLGWSPRERIPSYDIPYRALVCPLENLILTGRCISASHEALASIRITATALALGQASGAAAALALREGIGFPALDPGKIRGELVRQNASAGKEAGTEGGHDG
jgi:hypothetical protein